MGLDDLDENLEKRLTFATTGRIEIRTDALHVRGVAAPDQQT
jgi:hypothetical protein